MATTVTISGDWTITAGPVRVLFAVGRSALYCHASAGPLSVGADVVLSAPGDGGVRINLQVPAGSVTRKPAEDFLAKIIAEHVPFAALQPDNADGDRTLRVRGLYVAFVSIADGVLTIEATPAD